MCIYRSEMKTSLYYTSLYVRSIQLYIIPNHQENLVEFDFIPIRRYMLFLKQLRWIQLSFLNHYENLVEFNLFP